LWFLFKVDLEIPVGADAAKKKKMQQRRKRKLAEFNTLKLGKRRYIFFLIFSH